VVAVRLSTAPWIEWVDSRHQSGEGCLGGRWAGFAGRAHELPPADAPPSQVGPTTRSGPGSPPPIYVADKRQWVQRRDVPAAEGE